jgi:hypothetical protein
VALPLLVTSTVGTVDVVVVDTTVTIVVDTVDVTVTGIVDLLPAESTAVGTTTVRGTVITATVLPLDGEVTETGRPLLETGITVVTIVGLLPLLRGRGMLLPGVATTASKCTIPIDLETGRHRGHLQDSTLDVVLLFVVKFLITGLRLFSLPLVASAGLSSLSTQPPILVACFQW